MVELAATIRIIDRDPTRRLVTLTLDDNTRARLTYRQATQLGFWLVTEKK